MKENNEKKIWNCDITLSWKKEESRKLSSATRRINTAKRNCPMKRQPQAKMKPSDEDKQRPVV